MEAPNNLSAETDPPSKRLLTNYRPNTTTADRMNRLPTLPLNHPNMPPSRYKQGQNNQRQKKRRLLHIEIDLPCPSIDLLNPSCRSAKLWNYKRSKVLQIARETTPYNAFNTIYNHGLDITHIDSWRIVLGTGMTTWFPTCLYSNNSTSHIMRPRL